MENNIQVIPVDESYYVTKDLIQKLKTTRAHWLVAKMIRDVH